MKWVMERLRYAYYFPLGWILLSLYYCFSARSFDDIALIFVFVPLAATLGSWNAVIYNTGLPIIFGPRIFTLLGLMAVALTFYLGWRMRHRFFGKLLAITAGAGSGLVGFVGVLGLVD